MRNMFFPTTTNLRELRAPGWSHGVCRASRPPPRPGAAGAPCSPPAAPCARGAAAAGAAASARSCLRPRGVPRGLEGHGSKAKADRGHPPQHWGVHLPQNGTIGFDPQPYEEGKYVEQSGVGSALGKCFQPSRVRGASFPFAGVSLGLVGLMARGAVCAITLGVFPPVQAKAVE